MKNTEMRPSECIKADVLRRRILWQINIIERQISDCKKKFTCFYTQTQKKSHVSAGEKNKNTKNIKYTVSGKNEKNGERV